MACNSTGGGGGANMGANVQTDVIIPQNSEWPAGDVDGYKNMTQYYMANQMFGSDEDVPGSTISPAFYPDGAVKDWLTETPLGDLKGVRHYTGSSYYEINESLRNNDPSILKGADKKAIIGTTEALKNGVVPEPFIAHRGSSAHLITGTASCTLQDIQERIGEVVADKAFVSTSAVKGSGFGGQVLYHIKTPAGKGIGAYVDPISMNKGGAESEFLFQRGSKFRIVGGYEDSSGMLHCNLEYVGNTVGT